MDENAKGAELRRTFKLNLLQNPNYFGNLSGLDMPNLPGPVMKIIGDTQFEKLSCLGYNPDSRVLTAIVEVKLGSGYSGGPCTDGSHEYVRFYLDYGDGTWVDHGVASFNSHDLAFADDLCYAVSVRIKPKRSSCCDDKPVLPVVRAILSWNVEPPPGQPNWVPVWGNHIDRAIQIDPRSAFFCKFTDIFDVGVQQIDPALLAKIKAILTDVPPLPKPVEGLDMLFKAASPEKASHDKARQEKSGLDSVDHVLPLRHIYPMVAALAADKTDLQGFVLVDVLKKYGIDLSKYLDFLNEPKFDVGFEELHCVGLDRDMTLLHGIVQIKRSFGYSGGLCANGSKEYIAFYLDFGMGWEYQGTTSVDVHDIGAVPPGGLWYQASLPVNLDKHRRVWCETGRARIRGVLSWAVPPAPNQPEFIPVWGDREDCWIEVRPLPEGVPEGVLTPFLEAIGNMPVGQINASGFANGNSIGGGYTASDSPFGGVILLAGHIAFPTSTNLEYRVMMTTPSDPVPKAWNKSFDITVTTIIGASLTTANQPQTTATDWFPYIPTAGPVVFKSVAGNLLEVFQAIEEGLHTVRIDVREQGTLLPITSSVTRAFRVDNTAPVVHIDITSGAGNCGKFVIGLDVVEGTYSMADIHSSGLSLSVTPGGAAAGGLLSILTVVPGAMVTPPAPLPNASNGLSVAAHTMLATGASGTWRLDTTNMDPCGYNITIHASDRTIVNSGSVGWIANDIAGFCLE